MPKLHCVDEDRSIQPFDCGELGICHGCNHYHLARPKPADLSLGALDSVGVTYRIRWRSQREALYHRVCVAVLAEAGTAIGEVAVAA
jgi:hypothetical protein